MLFAAYNYLSGADNPEKLSHARHQLIYAAIATIIAFTAVGFEVIIKNFIGGGAETTAGTTGLPASGTGGGTTQKEATNLNNPSGGPTSPPLPPGSFQGDYIPPTGG
ncbi:hypothetical protein HY227_00495 [Candidatus Wolfebacteria bacterium]|nr:hypothetical protein [Candidatus Wolfebacteria bacterium]